MDTKISALSNSYQVNLMEFRGKFLEARDFLLERKRQPLNPVEFAAYIPAAGARCRFGSGQLLPENPMKIIL
jgi:hypothetical protein